jgi:hypothetical protein
LRLVSTPDQTAAAPPESRGDHTANEQGYTPDLLREKEAPRVVEILERFAHLERRAAKMLLSVPDSTWHLSHTCSGVVKWFFVAGAPARDRISQTLIHGALPGVGIPAPAGRCQRPGFSILKADVAHDFAVRTLNPKVSLTAT